MNSTPELTHADQAEYVNNQLRPIYDKYYLHVLDYLRRKDAFKRTISFPLLINPFPEYFEANVKLMIVGKETYSWPASDNLKCLREGIINPNIVELLLKNYFYFKLGAGKQSPFWHFCRKLNRKFNNSDNAFIWNNISKVDENKSTPKGDILKGISAHKDYPIIKQEIEILKPAIIVFLTGSIPETHLKNVFEGLELIPLTDVIFRMVHPNLPYHSYKTQHPKSLRIRRTFNKVIDFIYNDVNKALPAINPMVGVPITIEVTAPLI